MYERANLAEWIDEQAKENRRAGVPAPLKSARIDAIRMRPDRRSLEDALGPPPSDSEIATLKKKHLNGRREMRELRLAAEKMNRLGRK
jgi:hypothetical protein